MGKMLRNVLKTSSCALLLAISSGYPATDPVQRKLDEMMRKQEEVMDITYSKKPVLILKSVPEMSEKVGGIHRRGKIDLNSSLIGVWSALAHELGHFYIFINYQPERNSRLTKVVLGSEIPLGERNVIRYLTDEGIAAYFEYKALGTLSCKEDILFNLDLEKLRKGRKEYGLREFEELACGLVKPILDVNVGKGIGDLTRNPMTREDLENLVGYQQRILKIVKNRVDK